MSSTHTTQLRHVSRTGHVSSLQTRSLFNLLGRGKIINWACKSFNGPRIGRIFLGRVVIINCACNNIVSSACKTGQISLPANWLRIFRMCTFSLWMLQSFSNFTTSLLFLRFLWMAEWKSGTEEQGDSPRFGDEHSNASPGQHGHEQGGDEQGDGS